MNSPAIEMVTFQLADGVTENRFLAAAVEATIFLRACPGFQGRTLGQHPEDATRWLDLVYWEGLEYALAAAEGFTTSPHTTTFLNAIQPETVVMSHFVVRAT